MVPETWNVGPVWRGAVVHAGRVETDQVSSPVWATAGTTGWRLSLRVVPGSRRTEVAGPVGEQLKVKVAAPPNDGKANAELIRFVAASFGVPARDVKIRQGLHGRSKVVEIESDVALPGAWL